MKIIISGTEAEITRLLQRLGTENREPEENGTDGCYRMVTRRGVPFGQGYLMNYNIMMHCGRKVFLQRFGDVIAVCDKKGGNMIACIKVSEVCSFPARY